MQREENIGRSLGEIERDIQRNLQKLSAAFSRQSSYEPYTPQRALETVSYLGPASKYDPNQPRDDQGRWTDGNSNGNSREELNPVQGRPKPAQEGSKPAREKPKPAKDHVTSGQGIDFVKRREQFRQHVYGDEGEKSTIGYGHLLLPDEKFPDGITEEQALKLLAQDIKIAETAIQSKVEVDLAQHQFDALTSLVFNIGGSAFGKSTLLRLLNRGEYNKAANEFLVWNKVTKKGIKVTSDVLVKRRRIERHLFLGGKYE